VYVSGFPCAILRWSVSTKQIFRAFFPFRAVLSREAGLGASAGANNPHSRKFMSNSLLTSHGGTVFGSSGFSIEHPLVQRRD
jgi:hypothetical protein